MPLLDKQSKESQYSGEMICGSWVQDASGAWLKASSIVLFVADTALFFETNKTWFH